MNYQQPVEFHKVIDIDLLQEVFEHQKILDAAFLEVANREPETDDRADMVFDEAAEFVAEFKTINKYFTNKETDFSKVLDEHSDILHFIVGYYIETGKLPRHFQSMVYYYYKLLSTDFGFVKGTYSHDWQHVRHFLRIIRRSDSIIEVFAAATIIIGMCGFTKEDVLNQYRIKRDENYRRIAKTAKGEADR